MPFLQVIAFLRTGSYTVPCVSGSKPDWSGGSSPTSADCASGPFSGDFKKTKGLFSFLYTKTTYLRCV